MSSTARAPDEHPLLADEELLREILDVMYAKIHKVLGWSNPGLRTDAGRLGGGAGKRERALTGTGTGADDILADAFEALRMYPEERIEHSWQALAVRIAHNKTIEALRTAEKGRRGTEHRSQLYVVSGDAERPAAGGETDPSIFEVMPSEWDDLEAEYFALRSVLDLRDLARELLDDREQMIFFHIHFMGYKRKDVAEDLDLTGARVGQIYNAAVTRLEADSRYPYPTTPPDDE